MRERLVRNVPVVLALALAVGGAQAQGEPETLTLEQAVAIALENNPELGAARAQTDVAEATREETGAGHMPKVALSATYSRTTNPVYVFGNLLGQEAFTAENFDVDFLNRPDPLNNWNTMLSVRVPVYVGGRISNGVAAADAALAAAEADLERARQQVVSGVTEAYTGVALADAHLEVAQGTREVALENIRLVRDLREAGLVVQSDVLLAEVRLSEVEEMVARAESATRISRAGLNAVMGRDLDAPVRVMPQDDRVEAPSESLDELAAHARESRPDLLAAERRVAAAEKSTEAVRGALLPEVGVEGRVEANAEDFIGADGDNWSVFAAARWTVFEGKTTRSRVRRARAEADAARRMLRALEDRAGLELRTAWHELEAARRSREVAERSVGLAEESLRIVRDRYQEGLANLVELLDAENALTRARVRSVAANRDVRLARVSLDLAAGKL